MREGTLREDCVVNGEVPVVSVQDGFTVVDIPVALEHADGIGRVVLDADREVAGFFVRPREEIG